MVFPAPGGQQKTQGLARQHGFVDCGDLMGQRLHQRGVHGQHRIKQVGQANAVRLGREPKQGAVAVEAPGTARFHHLQTRLIVAIQDFFRHPPVGTAVNQGQCLRAVPFHIDHRHQHFGQNTPERRIRSQVFQFHTLSIPPHGYGMHTQDNTLQSFHCPNRSFTNRSIENAPASFPLFFKNEAMTGARFRPGGIC